MMNLASTLFTNSLNNLHCYHCLLFRNSDCMSKLSS